MCGLGLGLRGLLPGLALRGFRLSVQRLLLLRRPRRGLRLLGLPGAGRGWLRSRWQLRLPLGAGLRRGCLLVRRPGLRRLVMLLERLLLLLKPGALRFQLRPLRRKVIGAGRCLRSGRCPRRRLARHDHRFGRRRRLWRQGFWDLGFAAGQGLTDLPGMIRVNVLPTPFDLSTLNRLGRPGRDGGPRLQPGRRRDDLQAVAGNNRLERSPRLGRRYVVDLAFGNGLVDPLHQLFVPRSRNIDGLVVVVDVGDVSGALDNRNVLLHGQHRLPVGRPHQVSDLEEDVRCRADIVILINPPLDPRSGLRLALGREGRPTDVTFIL